MFADHQPHIGRFARTSPENFRRVCEFVLLTIRMPLDRAVADLHGLYSDHPDEHADAVRSALWGFKRDAWSHLQEHYTTIYNDCLEIWDRADAPADPLVDYLSHLPGFGMVKAGFVVQLAFGLSGCIDTHNLNRFGISPNKFKSRRVKRAATRLRRVAEYNATVADLGGTAHLWDSWCQYVADNQAARYTDADAVSRLHVEAMGLAA